MIGSNHNGYIVEFAGFFMKFDFDGFHDEKKNVRKKCIRNISLNLQKSASVEKICSLFRPDPAFAYSETLFEEVGFACE